MLGLVTSANVSCGFHAGNPEGIRATVDAATKEGVVIGAHPGYDDYEGFGRRASTCPPPLCRPKSNTRSARSSA